MSSDEERHSRALEIELITDPTEKAKQEAKNGLRQFDEVIDQIEYWLHPERQYRLRPSAILSLNRKALEKISSFAGVWRPTEVKIGGSRHTPPPPHLVAEMIEDMCEYINDRWAESPIHLSAYSLWRMNWIHPFVDGNGRTARAISYVILCVRLGYRLPGTKTIPEIIAKNKAPYYKALEAADLRQAAGIVDLGEMEELLESLLAAQLVSVLKDAGSTRSLEEG